MLKIVFSVLLVVQVALTTPLTETDEFSDEFIAEVQNIQKSWVAGRNFERHISKDHLIGLLGSLPEAKESKLPYKRSLVSPRVQIPESYDPREAIPNCPSLLEVRDQAKCGSCWSFGAVETMTDRTCILSNGTVNFHYSADDLLTCCSTCGFGCNGGYPSNAFKYWKKHGIVSGGAYNSHEGCRPYEKSNCLGLVNPDCRNTTPECKRSCIEEYDVPYEEDLHFGEEVYSVPNDELKIMTELYLHGPIEAAFSVYSDFYDYKSGVYHHVLGEYLGGHAVKMIGYGVEDGVPYWLLTNSWGYNWGEGGFFKMRRGNECGIQEDLVTGIPRFD